MAEPLCPICRRPVPHDSPRLRPFCSTRCADVDLGRWFNGAYVIPGPPLAEDEDGSSDVTHRT